MLLSCPLKIFCKIILRRLEKKVNETLRETQAGYRAGRSGIDHINTLRIIIEQIVEWQEVLHLVFVDFKKAFDSLIHEKIWDSRLNTRDSHAAFYTREVYPNLFPVRVE